MSRRPRRRKAQSAKARKARAGQVPSIAPTAPSPAAAPDGAERALRLALFATFGLLLLTPFVVTTGTVFPFVVGKALWSRSLIEIAFALWAVLALTRPGYAPPRSWLLVLLGIGLGVSGLSAVFGVSHRASLWSDYERMLGVVDQAHWAALAVMLASVLRTDREWRALLGAQVGVGAAVACLVVARALDIEVPFYSALPEASATRLGGPFGNPTFLSVYLLVNTVLAGGFAARAWSVGPPVGWLGAVALNLYGLILAGSVGGFVGLAAAVGFATLLFAWLSRGRRRIAALTLLGVLAAACAELGARALDPGRTAMVSIDRSAEQWPGGGALRYVGQVHLARPSVQSRLTAWRAGLEGFAERPLLGYGPFNYATVYGLFGTGYAATAEPHDQAHGKLIEVAATTGTAGVAAWLALWALALAVLLRAARAAAAPAQQAFTVFAAAALAGHLVQVQFLFDTAAGTLVATLLLAHAASIEPRAMPPPWRARLPGGLAPGRRSLALVRRRGARAVLGGAVVALALWGLAVNGTILAAADKRYVAPGAVASAVTAEAIEAFPPLAGFYRKYLFVELGRQWATLNERDPARAGELLDWAGREAAAARRNEPWNWRFEHLLANLYATVAATDPGYEATAQHHLTRARELAPAREPLPSPLEAPSNLSAIPLPADAGADAPLAPRRELRWSPSPGAGYHEIGRTAEPGRWRSVLFAYGPGRTTFIAPDGPVQYRIRACRRPSVCTAWEPWP